MLAISPHAMLRYVAHTAKQHELEKNIIFCRRLPKLRSFETGLKNGQSG